MVEQQAFVPVMPMTTSIASNHPSRLPAQVTQSAQAAQRRCTWVKSCASLCLMICLLSSSLPSVALAQMKQPPICHVPKPPPDPVFKPVVLLEVCERDQKWNKVPNPKNPPAYKNDIGIPPELIRHVLFIATEPSSDKVELTVRTSEGSRSGVTIFCGIRETSDISTGSILPGSVPVTSGETQIDFTPTGSVHEKEYRVVLGIDMNSDGQLSNNEVISNNAPISQQFRIRAVRHDDYQASLDYLDLRDDAFWLPVAQSFLSYFDGNATTISEATSLLAITVPITANDNPTHIAGSSYNPTNGETSIPRFKLPTDSKASNEIEKTLNRDDAVGLRSVIQNVWNANVASLAAPFIANKSLATSTSSPFIIAQGTTISFYENSRTDLKMAYGGANIHGTVAFELKRDPSNPLKVVLTSVTLNAVVDDMYDFDWTRPRNWPSREGATVQIGYVPRYRKGGKIFATETVVQHIYDNDDAIRKFNASWSITLPNPSPGTPITPPEPTQ